MSAFYGFGPSASANSTPAFSSSLFASAPALGASTPAFSSSLFASAPALGASTPAFSSSLFASAPALGASTPAFSSSLFASAPALGSAFTTQTPQSRRTNSTATTPVNEDIVDDLKKRISFLSGFVMAFKEQTHTDILLKPNNGPCIPAHKALLAARSEIFKNMLASDSCKVPPSDTDTITLSELNTEELKSLLEFLYTGILPLDKLEKQIFTLYDAADKYEIPYLQESCERYMLNSLNTSNAVDILEISDAHSNKTLKETTMKFIVRNMKDVVSSQKYENFASSNPQLCVQMTRAFVDAKSH